MKFSSKKVSMIVILITIAFAGLVILQTVLLKTALKSEEESFNRSVILALNKAASELSSDEARHVIFRASHTSSGIDHNGAVIRKKTIVNDSISDSLILIIETDDSAMTWTGEFGGNDEKIISREKILYLNPNNASENFSFSFFDTCMIDSNSKQSAYSYTMEKFDDSIHVVTNFLKNDSGRIMLIEAALNQFEWLDTIPLEERIDTTTLVQTISRALHEINIDLDYSFGVLHPNLDSILLSGRGATFEQLDNSIYRTRLFPFNALSAPYNLVVYFPDKQFYIFSKMSKLIFPTLLFLIILVGCFIYSIKTIVKQRETAAKLTDFINNMTHEFKTPISTIQLAVEAISKDEVMTDKEKLKQFNSMILSENNRMKNHVDKILQIATLEEGDYILQFEKVDMHEILNEAVNSLAIQLNMANGQIIKRFDADKSVIDGDPVHLINIIHNLLDNALKYSQTDPIISISTSIINNKLEIRINDNGIGVHENDLKHLFDKYYRVSHGDIHNVKGFGLGLSYVKMMTEAHKGDVSIASSLGKGTEITLTFPTA